MESRESKKLISAITDLRRSVDNQTEVIRAGQRPHVPQPPRGDSDTEPIFESEVPVIIDDDDKWPIGKAQCFRDPETGQLRLEVTFDPYVSEDIQNVLLLTSTNAISFAGAKNTKEEN